MMVFVMVSQGFWCTSLDLGPAPVREIAAWDLPALAPAISTLSKQRQIEKEIFACSLPLINAYHFTQKQTRSKWIVILQIVKLLKE